MTSIAATLTASQTNAVLTTADSIRQAAINTLKPSGFTFIANFDGTRNDVNNVELSGSRYSTNVAAIYTAIQEAN